MSAITVTCCRVTRPLVERITTQHWCYIALCGLLSWSVFA